MPITMTQENGRTVLRISGAMSIYEAAPAKQQLLDALDKATELEVDLSNITELDTTGVQLLLLLKREATQKHKMLQLSGLNSKAVSDVINTYHLANVLGDTAAMPPSVANHSHP